MTYIYIMYIVIYEVVTLDLFTLHSQATPVVPNLGPISFIQVTDICNGNIVVSVITQDNTGAPVDCTTAESDTTLHEQR